MIKKKKEFGIILFDYPFDGYFFLDSKSLNRNEPDKFYCFRTEILGKTMKGLSKWALMGALRYHSPGDFIVEDYRKLSRAQLDEINKDAGWGEYWIIGS